MRKVSGAPLSSSRPTGQIPAIGGPDAFGDDDRGISFYSQAPDLEVSVREFEELTCDRLKVLHAFDRLCLGDQGGLMNIPELKGKMTPEIHNARLDLVASVPGKADEYSTQKAEFRRRDSISHMALRLAFCKTRDARQWFLNQEQRLFVLRFDCLSLSAQEAFMKNQGVPCKRFDQANWPGYPSLGDLQKTTYGAKIFTDPSKPPEYETVFYEMPFFEIHTALISTRKVVIHQGKAFVPSSALKLILAARFKEQLIIGLDNAFNSMPNVLADQRVGPFIRLLQDHGLQLLVAPKAGSEDVGEKLSLDNFEELLVRSFPPCMRRLVEAQRDQRKHLKHAGRLQLRPFLKDAGFGIDESTKWWRQEITKDPTVDVTSFEKNYTYDLEHAYGKKGHFQGSNCFGCPKIIGFPGETAGQVHGCPFKLEMPALKQHLHRWRVPENGVAEIEKLITNGKHYQLGCIEYFKSQHQGSEGDGVGNSPMEYFKTSSAYYTKKKEKESGKSQAATATMAPAVAASA